MAGFILQHHPAPACGGRGRTPGGSSRTRLPLRFMIRFARSAGAAVWPRPKASMSSDGVLYTRELLDQHTDSLNPLARPRPGCGRRPAELPSYPTLYGGEAAAEFRQPGGENRRWAARAEQIAIWPPTIVRSRKNRIVPLVYDRNSARVSATIADSIPLRPPS